MKTILHYLAVALACLLSGGLAQAQNLFVSDYGSGNIYEFTPGGAQSTFASGLSAPEGLAFNSAGDLFEADTGSGNVYEFTPGGTRSTFASELINPNALAFDGVGNLYVATDWGGFSSVIYKFTPGGVQSTFASGLNNAVGLAFQPVPEPSTWALVGLGGIALLGVRRRN